MWSRLLLQLRRVLTAVFSVLLVGATATTLASECGLVERVASPTREVLPLLQAWRQAEALAATIPNGDVMVGRGESMMPVYPDSTVIVVQRMPMAELRPGMVVVFVGDSGRPVAHTLVAYTSRGWAVKGLANRHLDQTRVRSQNYLGTVIHAYVPYLPEVSGVQVRAGAMASDLPSTASRREGA